MISKLNANSNLLSFLAFSFSLVHFLTIVFYNFYSFESIFVFLIAIACRFFFTKKLEIVSSFAIFTLWCFLELSFSGHYFLSFLLATKLLPEFSFYLGQHLLLLFFLIYFAAKRLSLKKNPVVINDTDFSNRIASCGIISLTVIAFALSIISFQLDITQMGVVHRVLPYKLEPLLNLSRNVSIPILFTMAFHYFYSKKHIRIITFLIYLGWLCFEIYIRGSRGVLLSGMIPILIYSAKRFPLKTTIRNFLILLSIGFILFPIGKILRHKFSQTSQPISFSISHEVYDFYTRIFNDPKLITDFRDTFGNQFFTNRYNQLQAKGGAERYYTKIIAGNPNYNAHSQGLTAISDGYIYFGQFGAYITVIFLCFVALAIDSGLIPIINANIGTQSLAIYGLLNWLIWGEGLWDFYFTRSILTICVFPITLYLCYILFKKLNSFNERHP